MRRINSVLGFLIGSLFVTAMAQTTPTASAPISVKLKKLKPAVTKPVKLKPGICTPLVRITKYTIKKGEYPAAVLRKFGLEPVFGNKGSMRDFLKLNNFKNANKVEPDTIVVMPFHCEEEVAPYKVIHYGDDYREVVWDKVFFPSSTSGTALVTPMPDLPATPEPKPEKFNEIVGRPAAEQIQDVEAAEKNQDNISEALRYRMICEGEWTGSECITRYSAIFANIGGYNNRYDGVDSHAAPGAQKDGLLLSKLNLAAGFGWNNYWNDHLKTILYAELQNNQMLPDIKSVPIEGGDRLLTSLQAEVRLEKGNWGVGLGFRQFDKLYYVFNFQNLILGSICTVNDVSLCGVRVYSANVSSLFFDISYLIHQAGKFRFDTELKYFTIAPTKVSNVDVYAGSGQSVEFSVTHDRISEYLKGTMRYSMASQDTSIETQNAKEVAILFTYSWKLKDWSEATIKADSPSN